MKRSEMIKLIYDCMRDNHFGQYGEFYKMAESVLNTIEDNGMIPPATSYFIVNKPIGFIQTWSDVADYHNWEPEDDT